MRARAGGKYCSPLCKSRAVANKPGHRAKDAEQKAAWRKLNHALYIERTRRCYQKMRAKRLAEKRDYWQIKRDLIYAYRRRRLRENPHVRIACNLRTRIWHALGKQFADKTGNFRALVGCTVKELCAHLESLFQPGMTWENRHMWHVDHIKPCAAFNLTDPAEQRACFNYRNLQPLWVTDNLRKGHRGNPSQTDTSDI